MDRCFRCMQERSHLEFAPDGFAYCDECVFFGMNKQCAKCRMYVPFQELQQYKSGMYCPYCIMDMRDEDRKFEKTVTEVGKKADKPIVQPIETSDHCQRCEKVLERSFFIVNGIKLCKSCMEIERPKIKGFDKMEAQKLIFRAPDRKVSLMDNVLEKVGLKKRPKPKEIIVIAPKAEFTDKKPEIESADEEIKTEQTTVKVRKEEPFPQVEGIIKKKKKFSSFKTKTDKLK